MTETENGEVFEQVPDGPEPRKWCWWLLPSMFFALAANIFRAVVVFNDELAYAFQAHALWRQNHRLDTRVVDSFRAQLKVL